MQTIERDAFKDWESLEEVQFASASKLSAIGAGAFQNSGLTNFAVPNSLRRLSQGSFSECKRLERVELNEGLETLGDDGLSEEDVKRLPGVFQNSAVRDVVIPSTLRKVGPRAFEGCANLKEVKLRSQVEVLGEGCFRSSGVQIISIPASVVNVEAEAFADCALKQLTFEDNRMPEDIGEGAFRGYNSLLIIPEGTTAVKARQFNGSGIEHIYVPRSVKEIQDEAFANWSALRYVYFSSRSQLRKIGMGAFKETSLKRFIAPAMLREIGQDAFLNCKQLVSVELNEGLEVLGTATCPDGNQYYGIFANSSVSSVVLPSTLKQLGYGTFESCKMLKNIELPARLEVISCRCFSVSGLEKIDIPGSVREIKEYAFMYCDRMKEVTF